MHDNSNLQLVSVSVQDVGLSSPSATGVIFQYAETSRIDMVNVHIELSCPVGGESADLFSVEQAVEPVFTMSLRGLTLVASNCLTFKSASMPSPYNCE